MKDPHFPKTRAFVGTVLGRRSLGVRRTPGRLVYRPSSITEIMPLRPDGTKTTQDDPAAYLGLYVWNGKEWELHKVYRSRREAQAAAARIRRRK